MHLDKRAFLQHDLQNFLDKVKKMHCENPVMTIESLVAYGFKEYTKNSMDQFDRVWQFCVKDKKGKKFFVNVRLWCFSKYSRPDHVVHDSFDSSCQFDLRGPKTFDVTCSVNNMTPAQVVDWYENMFNRMNCYYYEIYEHGDFDDEGIKISFSCENCGVYLGSASTNIFCASCAYQKETGFLKPRFR